MRILDIFSRIFSRKPTSASQESKKTDERKSEGSRAPGSRRRAAGPDTGSSPACPYCNAVLTRAPKRRTACLCCGQPIFVRKGRLCKEDEARALDFCTRVGVPHTRFDKTRDALSKEFGHPASAADAAWRLMHTLLSETKDYHARKMIYFVMALTLWEGGKDHLHVAREARRMQLADWKQKADAGWLDLRGMRLTVITTGEASCPNCRKLKGTTLTYEEALKSSPIPVPECTNATSPAQPRGWCRCEYGLGT